LVESFGNAVTYFPDRVNGDYFQINQDGVYSIELCCYFSGTAYYGLLLNTTAAEQAADVFGSLVGVGTKMMLYLNQTASAESRGCCIRPFKAGDKLRVQSEALPFSAVVAATYMRVTQVSV